jgi:hypothetical protein
MPFVSPEEMQDHSYGRLVRFGSGLELTALLS